MRRLRRYLVATYFRIDPRSLGFFRILFGTVLLFDLYLRFVGVDLWYTDEGILGPPSRGIDFTFFFMVKTQGQAVFGMALCALAFLAFTVGFKTRTFHLVSFLCYLSLNNRTSILENGGHLVIGLFFLWSMFLPLGRRFSVDAILRAWRQRQPPGSATEPVVSVAVLAMLLQFSVIYLFNWLNKTGLPWSDGSAVHYALHQGRIVTAFGVWLRETLPYPATQFLSWGVLIVEAAAAPLILSPVWSRQLRLAAAVVLPMLHIGLASCLNLGAFSYVMASFFPLLLSREHWDRLGSLWHPRPADRLAVSGLAIRRWFGFPEEPRAYDPPSPARRWLSRCSRRLQAALVLFLMLVAFGELGQSNPAMPEWMRFEQPEPFRAIVRYGRFYQYWRMFAPRPRSYENMITVEARTAAGRLVDPFNEVAGYHARVPFTGFPKRLGLSDSFSNFNGRIALARNAGYLPAFQRWILRYHERTGNPRDKIVSFKAQELRNILPPPGVGFEPDLSRRFPFLEYPAASRRPGSRPSR